MVVTMNSTFFWAEMHLVQRKPNVLDEHFTLIFREAE
jgi:hypothetical protein